MVFVIGVQTLANLWENVVEEQLRTQTQGRMRSCVKTQRFSSNRL